MQLNASYTVAKISDFNISKRDSKSGKTTLSTLTIADLQTAITIQYASPELLEAEEATDKSDVYSFAILLYWQLLCVTN